VAFQFKDFADRLKQPKVLRFGLLLGTLCTLAIGIVIGTLLNTGVRAERQTFSAAPDATPLSIPEAVPVSSEFTRLTKRVEPSVVYIQSDYLPKVTKHITPPSDDDDSSGDPTSSDFGNKEHDPAQVFKKFFGKPEPRSFRSEGSGTGFVVDKNGYILTNEHVVENADRIKVRLAGDDNEYLGHVIGFDTETDVAVLKIDAHHPLATVQMGNSDSVQVGDWVIAIGSPFGLQATVTAGIVSAQRTSRDLPGTNTFQNFLQTDAAINPGNSGGPLLNTRGEVIGMNTMIATRGGSYEGIGFALPSNTAVKVYNDIIRQGRVVRGSIGISWRDSASQTDTLNAFGLDHGVIVGTVSPTGPAGKAGIKADDVIVAINDKPVRDGDDLVTRVADLPIGSSIDVSVDRDGKKLEYKVAIAERAVVWQGDPQVTKMPAAAVSPAGGVKQVKFGITIQRLTEKERSDLAIDDKSGVKVVTVDPGSFADDIGMQEGDTILSINRQRVASPDDVMRVQADFKAGQAIAVHIVRAPALSNHRAQPQRYYLSGRLPTD
jgi:serine protease Do